MVGGFPEVLSAVGMVFSRLGFNFMFPSGSGQALVTMPIVAPLSEIIGVTRQNAVLACQLGDGPSNIFIPTSGYLMAMLASASLSWDRWVRFFLPPFGIWVASAVAFLSYAQAAHRVG